MSKTERESISIAEAFAEVSKYSPAQRKAFIDELETDIKTLFCSMVNLYEEHIGVFALYGVQVEVQFSVFNELVYKQQLGCPEFFKYLKELCND